MIDFVKVGKKITLYRKNYNLTQDDLAEKLYVTRQLVSKWENGNGIPSIDVLIELASIFDVSIEDLLCLDEEIKIDKENIFKGHNRLFIIEGIIKGSIKVNIPEIFYQLSPVERMMVLKAISEKKVIVNMDELYPRLTPSEQKYIVNKGVIKI